MSFGKRPEAFREAAEVLKALAHPVRLCLVCGLVRCGGCAVREIQECLALPQATVSQQLAKLRAAGLVVARRRGKEVHYEVSSLYPPAGGARGGVPGEDRTGHGRREGMKIRG
ncbi:MAG: winged helix-turn-helix transcriptional regulator [Firmicutes bacterium]|nr:winged helix-turn-helix transcriptional regulator [Bacillota bacterium]